VAFVYKRVTLETFVLHANELCNILTSSVKENEDRRIATLTVQQVDTAI